MLNVIIGSVAIDMDALIAIWMCSIFVAIAMHSWMLAEVTMELGAIRALIMRCIAPYTETHAAQARGNVIRECVRIGAHNCLLWVGIYALWRPAWLPYGSWIAFLFAAGMLLVANSVLDRISRHRVRGLILEDEGAKR